MARAGASRVTPPGTRRPVPLSAESAPACPTGGEGRRCGQGGGAGSAGSAAEGGKGPPSGLEEGWGRAARPQRGAASVGQAGGGLKVLSNKIWKDPYPPGCAPSPVQLSAGAVGGRQGGPSPRGTL